MWKRLRAKYPLLLSDFNEPWIFSTDFSKSVLPAILRMRLKIQIVPRRKHRPCDKERLVNAFYVSDSKYTVWLECGILLCWNERWMQLPVWQDWELPWDPTDARNRSDRTNHTSVPGVWGWDYNSHASFELAVHSTTVSFNPPDDRCLILKKLFNPIHFPQSDLSATNSN
jgi:hypothetical protein